MFFCDFSRSSIFGAASIVFFFTIVSCKHTSEPGINAVSENPQVIPSSAASNNSLASKDIETEEKLVSEKKLKCEALEKKILASARDNSFSDSKRDYSIGQNVKYKDSLVLPGYRKTSSVKGANFEVIVILPEVIYEFRESDCIIVEVENDLDRATVLVFDTTSKIPTLISHFGNEFGVNTTVERGNHGGFVVKESFWRSIGSWYTSFCHSEQDVVNGKLRLLNVISDSYHRASGAATNVFLNYKEGFVKESYEFPFLDANGNEFADWDIDSERIKKIEARNVFSGDDGYYGPGNCPSVPDHSMWTEELCQSSSWKKKNGLAAQWANSQHWGAFCFDYAKERKADAAKMIYSRGCKLGHAEACKLLKP